MTVPGAEGERTAAEIQKATENSKKDKGVRFKNCASFTDYISK